MSDSSNPKVWLEIAQNEFEYACSDLSQSEETFFAATCFHFQQVAEESLKAFLLSRRVAFRKTHNLIELAQSCTDFDEDFSGLVDQTSVLNPFYTDTRYPVHWPIGFTREDAQEGKEAAGRILDLVSRKINKS